MGSKTADFDKLRELSDKNYEEQAVWFLNAFWSTHEDSADDVWRYYNGISEIDDDGAKGSKVNQLTGHRFLERTGNPQTVLQLSTKLKRDAGKDQKNKTFSLIEYLYFNFDVDLHKLVNAPQNANNEEIEKAQKELEEANTKMNVSIKKTENSKKAEKEQRETEADVERTCNELKKQEDEYEKTTNRLKFNSTDENKGIVFRNRSKNELEQHLAKDTLELRSAKINQDAALRKAKVATEKAEKLRVEAEKALEEAKKAFETAQETLDEIKKMGGSGQGTIYFMEKKLNEAKKYLPQSKGGISRD